MPRNKKINNISDALRNEYQRIKQAPDAAQIFQNIEDSRRLLKTFDTANIIDRTISFILNSILLHQSSPRFGL